MNYSQLKTYLRNQVIITTSVTNDQVQDTNQVQSFNNYFLKKHNLTASPELIATLDKFYQSLLATLESNDKYYSLPTYKDLTNNYFTTNKPSLGLKSSTGIEEAISNEHYQLLDQIITDQSLKPTSLKTQAQDLDERIKPFLEQIPNTDQQEALKVLKQTLTDSPAGQVILTELEAWLKAYQKISSPDQSLANQAISFRSLLRGKIDDLALLQIEAESLNDQIIALLTTQEDPVTNLEVIFRKNNKFIKLIQARFTGAPALKISKEIKKWIAAAKRLPDSDQDLVVKPWTIFNTILDAQEDELDEETKETAAKAKEKKQQHLLYFGGGILILAVLAMLFKKD